MNNRLSVQSTFTGLIHKKSSINADLVVLLNQIPSPVMVFDRHKNEILVTNNELVLLTNSTKILGDSPESLFPDVQFSKLSEDQDLKTNFIRKGTSPLLVNLRVKKIEPTGGVWIGIVEMPHAQEEDPKNKFEGLVRGIRKIVEFGDIDSDKNGFDTLVEALKLIFDTNIVGIYRADNTTPRLICVSQSHENKIFPEIIPSTDLVRLSTSVVWAPGKRMVSELHKIARISGLSYVASTPLGQNGRWSGLLVVAGMQKDPPREICVLLEVCASIIAKIFDFSVLVDNLKSEIEKQGEALFVRSQLFDNLIEGILLVNSDLMIQQINRTAEWMLGYAEWEVKGKPLEHILISQDRLIHTFESARQGVAIPNSGSVSLHRRNGTSFPAQVKLYPVEKNNKVRAILVFIEDISENEMIKAQAQHLEHRALLGEVIAVFAHEVRNPLNNLSTGLQLMSARFAQEDPNQELITRLQTDCDRMSHLMESVLIYARQSEYKLEEIDLAVYTKRLLDRWQPRLARVSVNAYFQAEEGNTRILGDPRALEQVFINLLSNSIDAMGKTGGTLAIKVSPISVINNYPQVEVTVSDNGPGIPEEIRGRIFEPFITTKQQGTGLGLAITKRIIVGHKGNISVDSFPGGTVFKIIIPAIHGEN